MPFLYGWRAIAPIKWLLFNVIGLFKPMARRPWSTRDIDEVALKSCALACENFMLAIAAQGFDTCPMEGFDEARVKRLLRLSRRARVAMVISVGRRDPAGVWGARYRLPKDTVVHRL
jgi:nitroreductase